MMKKFVCILSAVLALSFSAKAQDTFYPGWTFGVQGGANYCTSNNWGLGKFEHLNPNASVNLGYDITPWFGVRGSLSGPRGNYPIQGTTIGKFNYLQLGLDAMFDVCNMFTYKESRFLSPYFFLGAGANYRFAVAQENAYFGPAVRAGAGLGFRLAEGVHLTFELLDNALSNKWNTLDDNALFAGGVLNWKRPFRWDDNFAALLGVKFDFGANAQRRAAGLAATGLTAAATAEAEAEAALLAAKRAAEEKAAAERAAAERAAKEKAAREAAAAAEAAAREAIASDKSNETAGYSVENIYFDLNKSVLRSSEQPKVDHLVAVMKQYPATVVTLTGYADKQTGTASRNMTLSKERADRIAAALMVAGISADRIIKEFHGDTIQVSNVPEQNRVTVCVTK